MAMIAKAPENIQKRGTKNSPYGWASTVALPNPVKRLFPVWASIK
jgi:hypothetical protein